MGRRAWTWAIGTAVALLLTAWVSGAGAITAFTTPTTGLPATKEDGELVGRIQTDNSSPRGPRAEDVDGNHVVTTVVVWTLRVLLVVLVAAVLYFLLRTLLGRLRRDPVTVKDETRAGIVPDVLVAGLRESEAELDRGTSGEAVINAWLALERTAVAVGVDDDRSRTPAELVSAVLTDYDVDEGAIQTLASLYREARFSAHPINEGHRDAARAALRRVQDDLAIPLQADVGASADVEPRP